MGLTLLGRSTGSGERHARKRGTRDPAGRDRAESRSVPADAGHVCEADIMPGDAADNARRRTRAQHGLCIWERVDDQLDKDLTTRDYVPDHGI